WGKSNWPRAMLNSARPPLCRFRPANGNNMPMRRWLAVLLCATALAGDQASLEKAKGLLTSGSQTEAVALLRQIVAADPTNPEARTLLGTTLALQGVRS